MLAAAMKPLARRVGAHHDPGERQADDHGERGAAAAGDERIRQREMHVRVGEHGGEILERQIEHAEAVHHRIGVGERAKEQHRHGIEDEERQNEQEPGRPEPVDGKCAGARRARSCGAPRQKRRRWRMQRSLQSPVPSLEHFPAKWTPVRRRKCDHLRSNLQRPSRRTLFLVFSMPSIESSERIANRE